jgi:carbon monoxide dehydrogenase subunit G
VDLTHSFTVPASVGDAWAAFNDLERIAPCFPGAVLTAYDGESFEGLVKVKLGPISLQYAGAGQFVERDGSAHRAVIEAKGKDKRGNGTAAATITTSLVAAGAGATDVTVRTDLNITGKPAQFGRGVMQDVSDKLLAQFASCLETKLAETTTGGLGVAADTPAPGGSAGGAEQSSGPTPAPSEPAAPADLGTTPPASSRDGDKSGERAASSSTRRGESRRDVESGAAALDLGSAVLPVLLRRFAPHLVGAFVGVWLLRTILRRRRQRG